MKISVLASGSNGNAVLVEESGARVLIDAGLTALELERRMRSIGGTLAEIDALIISHRHRDHVSAAGVIGRRFGVKVYVTREDYDDLAGTLKNARTAFYDRSAPIKLNGLEIRPVHASHDVPNSGFIVNDFGLFTDTGCVTLGMFAALPALRAVLIESNHDVEMLKAGPYPRILKERVLSERGHLSNAAACEAVEAHGAKLKLVLLGHLSEVNNTPALARRTFDDTVRRRVKCDVLLRTGLSGTWEF
jgi:phosphoribosyl 1,2-cyclic phosphodiesterase